MLEEKTIKLKIPNLNAIGRAIGCGISLSFALGYLYLSLNSLDLRDYDLLDFTWRFLFNAFIIQILTVFFFGRYGEMEAK
jgi:hypothetical protein